jgi:hypothetical protein
VRVGDTVTHPENDHVGLDTDDRDGKDNDDGDGNGNTPEGDPITSCVGSCA